LEIRNYVNCFFRTVAYQEMQMQSKRIVSHSYHISRKAMASSWIQSLSEVTDTQSWPPFNKNAEFDWSKPTNEVYASREEDSFTTTFSQARSLLDYTYHANPLPKRQLLQDDILRRVVESTTTSATDDRKEITEGQQRPWMVFTAGPMGVGKGYVLNELNKAHLFPINEFIKIDPDLIKSELPEMPGYIQVDPVTAATRLHRESTQMADVLLEHALAHNQPILVDGSLRDVKYYRSFLQRIRRDFLQYQIGILQIVASREVIFQRAKFRGEKTGRVVPPDLLEESIRQVPASVEQLSPLTDVVFTIENNEGKPLRLINNHTEKDSTTSWNDFAKCWKQKQEHVSSKDIVSQMETMYECSQSHELANQIWKNSYPNFCARCSLSCGQQCGICIHGRHLCACKECKQ